MSTTLKPIRGIRINKSHPLARGLVGYWLLNEGTGSKIFDLSGNGNTGTLQGDTHFVPGKFGSALDFDGTGDYVDIPISNSLNMTGDIFVSYWLYYRTVASNNYDGRVIYPYSSGNGYEILHYIYTSGNFKIIPKRDYSTTEMYYKTTERPNGFDTWVHIGVLFNGTAKNATIYINGQKDTGNYEETIDGVGNLVADFTSIRIGYPNFDCLIDHIMIFNRALSASEIALLYREPFCMFDRAWRPGLIGGQFVELVGTSDALSSLSATAKATRKVGATVASTSDVAAVLRPLDPEMEKNWLREALFNGMTANAFKLGTSLSLGWFWVRVAGCSALYRGSARGGMEEIDFANILTVSEQDEYGGGEISPPTYIPHNSGSTYFYVIRRFNNCGYQERTLAAAVKVSISFSGDLADPQPNNISSSKVKQIDNNKIQLVWFYCPLAQKSQPVCFNVYYDDRTGQIDFLQTPLATIGYKGPKYYSFQSSALEVGEEADEHLFAIRAEDAGGIENSSLARLRIQLDTASPDAVDILSVEGV